MALTARSSKLLWIEVGRGIAALAVVVSHLVRINAVPAFLVSAGAWGVSFFFVLSGFIIAYVHSGDIGRPITLKSYLGRRLSRIFPVYWLLLPVAILLLELKPAPYRPAIPLGRLVTDALLIPNGYPSLLEPAWTLRHELIFYGVFALALANWRVAAVAFVTWGGAILWHLIAVGPYPGAEVTLPGIMLHQANLFFFAGLALCWATKIGKVVLFAVIGFAFAATLFAVGQILPSLADRLDVFKAVALFSAIVGVLVHLSMHDLRAPRALVGLGAISYALYLSHLPLFMVLHSADRLALHPLSAIWGGIIILPTIAAVGVATLIYIWFDRRVMRWLTRRVKQRKATIPHSPPSSPHQSAPASPLS